MKEVQLTWYTIPEFSKANPVNVYHKENEPADVGVKTEPKNLHVLARARVNAAKGGRKLLWISADDYYKLYINGHFLCQGPAPAYPESYYYNEIDITPFLEEGENILAVHLYYQGLINRVWNSGDGRMGLAAKILDEEGEEELVWKYRISQAYSGDTIGYETQYLENFDSRLWEEEWNNRDYDDTCWSFMEKADWGKEAKLTEQPTKTLAVYEEAPARIEKKEGRWFIDIGREITGALKITARGKEGNRIIIHCGEEMEEGQVRWDMRCNCRYEEIWTLKEGISRLVPYDYKGFRYAELLFEKDTEILEVKAQIRHYPMDESLCTLTCRPKVLEDIFSICKNGVKCGTQEGYLDCPTREKGQYLGDAVVTAHSQVWLTGSVDMLRKCIKQFALTDRVCPGLMAVAPGSYMQEIADFSLLWSQLLLLDYQFTKDKEFLRQYYPTAKGIIRHFKMYARKDGLLETVSDKWNLVDWPENLRDDYDFTLGRPVSPGCHNVINALYAGSVKTLEELEEILQIPSDHEFESLKAAFQKTFYMEERRLFRDSETSTHASLHSHIYSLYFGLCPKEAEDSVADFMLEKGLCCGVLLSYFYLKALAKIGRYSDVYRMLVNDSPHGWVNMLREGATACMEAWGKDQKWNTSLCHPWASAPIPVLIEDIAGFMPEPESEQGYSFKPHIPEEVDEFSLQIPFRGKLYAVEKTQKGCECREGENFKRRTFQK